MGLRAGELLNALCPGNNGPSDFDHVLHNGHRSPERLAIVEYKPGDALLPEGQRRLLEAVKGQWRERHTDRLLDVRYVVVGRNQAAPGDRLAEIVDWVWPYAAA